MKVLKKVVALVCFMAAVLLTRNAKAYSFTYSWKYYIDTNALSDSQFQTILNTLRDHLGDDTSGDMCPMYNTGLTFSDFGEAFKAEQGIRTMFLGYDGFTSVVERSGATDMASQKTGYTEDGRVTWSYHYHNGAEPTYSIYVGWLPESDPYECMRQHDEAQAVVDEVAFYAPEGEYEAYKYFNDWLCDNIEYDYNKEKYCHEPYAGLVEGSCVCSGYADAFTALCRSAGIYCISVNCSIDDPNDHRRNAVYYNGDLKFIDVTWDDKSSYISYDYFLTALDDKWITYFLEPWFVIHS